MADLDTMHRIVEKLEVTGEKDASKRIDTVAKMADKLAEALGFSAKEGKGVTDVLGDVEKTSTKASGGFFKMAGGLAIVTQGVQWLSAKLKELLTIWWDVNKSTEAMAGRIQGVSLGLLKFGKGQDKISTSLKLTNILLAEFRDHAIRIGVDIPDLEKSYVRINSVMSAMGKNQYDVLKVTKMTASAAKVYGENLEQAGSIISKAIIEGTVEGESAFAKAFKAQVGAMPGRGFNKLPIEKRADKIKKVLEEMGAPVDVIATDTESALMRWKVLSEDVLQRVTYPLYKKIGETVQGIVNYLEKNKSTIDAIVDKTVSWFSATWDVASGVASIVYGVAKWVVMSGPIIHGMRVTWKLADLFAKAVHAAGIGFKLFVEIFELRKLEHPWQKTNALVEAFKLKMVEILKLVKDIGVGLLKMLGGEHLAKAVRKIPGVGKQIGMYIDQLKTADRYFDKQVADYERRVAKMEKLAGLSPTTELGQRQELEAMGVGVDKDARLAWLKKMFGKKRPLVNVQNMNVHQDFRDVSPDNIMVEMVRLYESLAEEALSSNVGGEESVFAGAS